MRRHYRMVLAPGLFLLPYPRSSFPSNPAQTLTRRIQRTVLELLWSRNRDLAQTMGMVLHAPWLMEYLEGIIFIRYGVLDEGRIA
jgi:predicted ABC-type transport system involved in lysophospholipase L1 biosynthesis ATPase subunit